MIESALAAVIGGAGAAIAYFASWMGGETPKSNSRMAKEAIGSVVIAAFLVSVIFVPQTRQEALYLGAGWQGLIVVGKKTINRGYERTVKRYVKH